MRPGALWARAPIRYHCPMLARLFPLSVLVSCAACASTPAPVTAALVDSGNRETAAPVQQSRISSSRGPQAERGSGFHWQNGQPLMHGFLGVSTFSKVEADNGRIDGDDGDLDELPLIGGGAQWRLGGRNLDLGLEGLMSFSGRADAAAFVVGGGGAAVAVDVDLLIFELYGGPFASKFLGENLRLYGALGPLMQWADYDQTGNGLADDGSGFGFGWYARTGLEFALPSRTLLGFGARWSDSSVDLGNSLGDLEIDGLQLLFTVSRGI